MKRDTFIQMVIFKQIFHFCIFRRNFNCPTSPTSMPNFCIGFWNDIGNKKSEKNHFRVLPISRENYPCRPVFEGFELNRKTSPPFLNKQNRELWMFSGRGFKTFKKKCKNKKKIENDHRKRHENKNRPNNEAKMGISQSKAQVGSKSQWHMKD